MHRTTKSGGKAPRRTDWSRARGPMPASFADQPRRDAPVEGRRDDDGLELIDLVAGTAALAAVAELAAGGEAPRAQAIGVGDEDLVATADEPATDLGAPDADDED